MEQQTTDNEFKKKSEEIFKKKLPEMISSLSLELMLMGIGVKTIFKSYKESDPEFYYKSLFGIRALRKNAELFLKETSEFAEIEDKTHE